jgi:hypothetical protein
LRAYNSTLDSPAGGFGPLRPRPAFIEPFSATAFFERRST